MFKEAAGIEPLSLMTKSLYFVKLQKLIVPLILILHLLSQAVSAQENTTSSLTPERRVALAAEAAERFAMYLARPDQRAYSEFYIYLIRHPLYDPISADFDLAEQLFLAEEYERAIRVMEAAWPNYLLTPQAHFLLTGAYRKTGNEEKANRHSEIGKIIRRSLKLSGAGTQARPYYVTRAIAERDLFSALGVEIKTRRRTRVGERVFDIHITESGQEIWLESTFILEQLKKKKTDSQQ